MTQEKKAITIEKRRQTYEARRQREQEKHEDDHRTIAVLKEIRDNPKADPVTRLRAIELLRDLIRI